MISKSTRKIGGHRFGLRTFLLASFLLLTGSDFAQADLFTVPPLHVQSFASLGLPPMVSRSQLQMAIQTFSDQQFGRAFVDIGDMSDFMHGHILWDPKIHELKRDIPLAILFHTQEFPNLRPDGYLVDGQKLDPYNRNWISWQEPFKTFKVNELTAAKALMPHADGSSPTTVSSDMLDSAIFGKDATERSVTFFFYRFACEELEKRKIAPAALEASNIINVRIGQLSTCLAVVNESCNTSKETSADCPGNFTFSPIDHRNK